VDSQGQGAREGSLEAPTRHPVDWRSPGFYDRGLLEHELERVFDICHGCRRCFSLCNAFPTLFDAVDATASGEVKEVAKSAYWQVVDHCYLCDLCYMTKCPYVPPHPWNVDFPHLMLRAKAQRLREDGAPLRDRLLSATDTVGSIAGIPVVRELVNAVNASATGRKLLQATLGVHANARVPRYARSSFRRSARPAELPPAVAANGTRGQVLLLATCYCDRNEPGIDHDLMAVLEHNGIAVKLLSRERCCGMPKLELGDLDAVAKLKAHNVPDIARAVAQGHDVLAAIPSCVLMYKQELPLLFPEDRELKAIRPHLFDPFEYLYARHKAGLLRTDFKATLGRIAYHVPCHLRVQNLGLRTRDVLALVPGTSFELIERCSGHDGTYALKREFHEAAMKIARPVVAKVKGAAADHYASDCPMAGAQIAEGLGEGSAPVHPLTLLRRAYGLPEGP
jgi:glycerol-3-phosphate dehydrogenase subunit C